MGQSLVLQILYVIVDASLGLLTRSCYVYFRQFLRRFDLFLLPFHLPLQNPNQDTELIGLRAVAGMKYVDRIASACDDSEEKKGQTQSNHPPGVDQRKERSKNDLLLDPIH